LKSREEITAGDITMQEEEVKNEPEATNRNQDHQSAVMGNLEMNEEGETIKRTHRLFLDDIEY